MQEILLRAIELRRAQITVPHLLGRTDAGRRRERGRPQSVAARRSSTPSAQLIFQSGSQQSDRTIDSVIVRASFGRV